ncbi:MAG TPA: adenylate/guanylate cyclase domain-containing protein [Candidatus Limnocylindrales bacterium]|nr:adenylate/guanylate cyclase domain-containing protein [Candidatus Limnocylindrales bacterium]
MVTPSKKSFDAPDERVDVPGITADVLEMADSTISRSVFQPGTHCPQISNEGKPLCLAHHTGYVVDGALHVVMQDGSVIEAGPNDVYDIPPGHDGWAVGDQPLVSVNWAGYRSWVPERIGERVLLTLLFTDIVGSTERAVALGDSAWREQLAQHYRAVRSVLDRFRGREVSTAGDGFLASFDGAARAIQAGVAIRDRAIHDGLSIRAGVHSGEVEIAGSDLRGVNVHEAARIAAAAEPDEILVSEATRLLASGGAVAFELRGSFELKGLPGARSLYAVRSIERAPSR